MQQEVKTTPHINEIKGGLHLLLIFSASFFYLSKPLITTLNSFEI